MANGENKFIGNDSKGTPTIEYTTKSGKKIHRIKIWVNGKEVWRTKVI